MVVRGTNIMKSDSKMEEDTEALQHSANALLSVVQQFSAVLTSSTPVAATNIPRNPPNALDVLHTSATLLRAHSTKLSLLMINKPFTPTAIKSVISDVSATCVPAMMSAVEICQPAKYGKTMHEEVKARTRTLFRELEAMMKEVLSMAALASDGSNGQIKNGSLPSNRDSLASTGVVWEACESLMELKSLGLAGLLARKATEYRELLVDAIDEMKEWAEDAEDEGFEEDDEGLTDGEDSITQMLTATNKFPSDREDLRKTLNASQQRLRLVSSLYQALITKRLKTIPHNGTTNLTQADSMMKILRQIPTQADHLAEVFYELDNEGANKILGEIIASAKDAVKLGRTNWNARNDEFTAWCDKWGKILDKI